MKRASASASAPTGRKIRASSTHGASTASAQGNIFDRSQYYATLIPPPRAFRSETLECASKSWEIKQEVSDKNTPKENSLHFNIRPIVQEAFKRVFDAAGWVIELDYTGWVIARQAGVLLELQLEINASEHTERKIPLLGAEYSRTASVRVIPGDSHGGEPDAVLSLLAEGKRVPIFYLDFKFNTSIADHWGQLSAYMLTGLKRLKSATGVNTIAGCLLNYVPALGIGIFGCNLALSDFEFKAQAWPKLGEDLNDVTMDRIMEHICTHTLRFASVKCSPSAPLQLVSFVELATKLEDLKAEVKMDVVSTRRHTIYRVGGEYIKIMFEPHLTRELLDLQTALTKHLLEHLGEEHKHVIGLWKTIELGPHMWAVRSQDAGKPFRTHDLTKESVIKFIKAMLVYCQIPPLLLGDTEFYAVHGDLRIGNVTADLKIIDFEFLGYQLGRSTSITAFDELTEHWEITLEQRLGGYLSQCTNVWQVGLLISQMFVGLLNPKERHSIHKITTSYVNQTCHLFSFNDGLQTFLMDLKKSMLTEMMWAGTTMSNQRQARNVVTKLLHALEG